MAEPRISPEASDSSSNGASSETAGAAAEELETLKGRMAATEAERDQFKELVLRTRADFENYQKRNQKERELERRYSHGPLAADLLVAFDNLDRANAAAQQAGETGPLVQGVAMVQAQILDIFKRHGIEPIEALGQPFDPSLHQAVMEQASKEQPPGTVLQVLQQGFQIHDRVLRPASVVVSRVE